MEAVKRYRVIMPRVLSSLGDTLNYPIEIGWVRGNTWYHKEPTDHHSSGARMEGGWSVFETEEEAFACLLAEFDKWASEKRDLILRKGVPLPRSKAVLARSTKRKAVRK